MSTLVPDGAVEDPAILQVGISDLIAHRECPRRAAYGARRHTRPGEQDHASRTPEAGSPATWYGSCIHDVIDLVEEGWDDDPAIEKAWATWGAHLYPEDLALLRADLEQFRTRDFGNVRTVLAEGELQIPLSETPDGRPIYFRCRIDRLYERLDAPGHLVHVDYKSGKWGKTQADVDSDLQLWAYNWAIQASYPWIVDLEQWMDQFRHGMISTRKTLAQLDEIQKWLAIEARSYFEDPELQEDGLPAPRFNQWCPYCPILESCSIVPHLSDWALTRIATLTEDVPTSAQLTEVSTPIEEYVAEYDDAQTALKVLKRYADSVKGLVHEMSADDRTTHGFKLSERRNSVIDVRARKALYESLGHDRFMEIARVTKDQLASIEDEDQREAALGLVQMLPGSKVVTRKR